MTGDNLDDDGNGATGDEVNNDCDGATGDEVDGDGNGTTGYEDDDNDDVRRGRRHQLDNEQRARQSPRATIAIAMTAKTPAH